MEQRIVIIDDDPTGCQTVSGVPVFLAWDEPLVRDALARYKAFFLLTDTRAMTAVEARKVSDEVAENLLRAAAGRYRLVVMSRSDSTLRGHLLPEIEPILRRFGPFDGMILCPAFFEGDRYTIDNIHYARTLQGLIPVTETEFARDPVFGYAHAALPEWLEEVSGGFFRADRVLTLDTRTIRAGRAALLDRLMTASETIPVVVNALDYADMARVDEAVRLAEAAGKRFFYRTAASMVRVRLGQTEGVKYRPAKPARPGVVVVGSYTDKTTAQVERLLQRFDLGTVEIDVRRVPGDAGGSYARELTARLDGQLRRRSCVVYTSRVYALSGTPAERLRDGASIAAFVDNIVRMMTTRPGFIVSKGGITSYTVARRGLGMTEAAVLGQAAPGVPVWRCGPDAKFPGLDYVVFPGNVGDADTLAEVFADFV